jgi:hypothetical protein
MEAEIISELAGNVAALIVSAVSLPTATGIAVIGLFRSIGKLWGSGVERRRDRKAGLEAQEQNHILQGENDDTTIN